MNLWHLLARASFVYVSVSAFEECYHFQLPDAISSSIHILDAFDDVTAYLICKASARMLQTLHNHCQHAACPQLDRRSAQKDN